MLICNTPEFSHFQQRFHGWKATNCDCVLYQIGRPFDFYSRSYIHSALNLIILFENTSL